MSGTNKGAAALGSPDLERLEHLALALAQSEIQNALNESGLNRAELAAAIDRSRSFITRIMSGNHNLTIRTMARVLGACGFESRFGRHPVEASARVVVEELSMLMSGYEGSGLDLDLDEGDGPTYTTSAVASVGPSPSHERPDFWITS